MIANSFICKDTIHYDILFIENVTMHDTTFGSIAKLRLAIIACGEIHI